jgi:exodeoxyribonuclease V beta subunit
MSAAGSGRQADTDPVGGADAEAFDAGGPLPAGVTVLEASAGTGKTFAIAALAARYVAAGTPLPRLLLVTFTRAATGELRERVRQRLASTERGLARALAGAGVADDDPVVALLADAPPDEIEARRRRLADALADFDAATIATTHGFCHHVLGGLGVVGDVDRDVAFVDDPGDLVEEVVDDLYVRKFHGHSTDPPFDRRQALAIAWLAVRNPDACLEPRDVDPDSNFAMRRRLAQAVRAELERRKRRRGVITYDDLLTRLAATLRDPQRGAAARRRLRQRYHVALIDEFQDTDPVQWDILRLAFGDGGSTLVLIGDPKQAIYAFRGADVHAYLSAVAQAGCHATLTTNRRSDQGLLDAYDALFGDAALGHPAIPYRAARAPAAHQASRLVDPPVAAPLRVRALRRDPQLVGLTDKGYVSAPPARQLVADDVAGDIAGLLASPARVASRHPDGTDAGHQPVRPAHVAVLVATNRDAQLVHQSLAAAGVPAVLAGVGSVFATPAATQWLCLLEALEQPTSPTRARLAALTPFVARHGGDRPDGAGPAASAADWDGAAIATASEAEWEALHRRLHHWADVLRRRGVAALLETITVSERLPERRLARPGGERELSDLRHLGELAHAATDGAAGPSALAGWLRQRLAEAGDGAANEERRRRLESDAEAVQVLTVHRSKGLEFSFVYCPFLWRPGFIPDDAHPVFHDPDNGDRRTIDVGGSGSPGYNRRRQRHIDEERGEELRLAYVALTRARHQAVLWWAPAWGSHESPLCRLLLCRDGEGSLERGRRRPPADDEMAGALTALADRAPGCVSVEGVAGAPAAPWQPPAGATGPLQHAAFHRALDHRWARASYTSIVAHREEPPVASEPDEGLVGDEALATRAWPAARDAGEDAARLRAHPSPLADVPGGASVGTLIHTVLGEVDFAAPDLAGRLATEVRAQCARRHVDVGDPDAVAAGLAAAITTPLGPISPGESLADVAPSDRVDEMGFELALAGGEHPVGAVEPAAIGRLLRAHTAADDPLAGYAERLEGGELTDSLRGFLTGSIDLVVRRHLPGGGQRFVLIDFKTDRLGGDDEALSAWHYRPAALAEVMGQGHYRLQALLYTVALYRYLRWRLPDADPAAHLGGVAYLFVRGMTGPDTPRVGGQPCGVFAWHPPTPLVAELSQLLDTAGARR